MDYPRLNDYWHIRYGEAVGKEINIIARVTEVKKELTPANWRKNTFKCEHKGEELLVNGEFFVERFLSGLRVFTDTVSPLGVDILNGRI